MADIKIKAILSEMDKVDADGDVILAGAFDSAIDSGMQPDMLYMHRRGEIVGQWSGLRVDGSKLVADGVIYAGDYDLAQRSAKLIRTGQLSGVSIGFSPTKWTNVSSADRPYGWDIEGLVLREASLVDVPANDSAHVTEIKRKFEAGKESGEPAPSEIVLHKACRAKIEIVDEAQIPDTPATQVTRLDLKIVDSENSTLAEDSEEIAERLRKISNSIQL